MRALGSFSTCAALLLAVPSWAHGFDFNFTGPSGAGNRVDGGYATIQWTDFDALGVSTISLFASRRGYAPFEAPDAGGDVAITTTEISIASSIDFYQWNAASVPAGCYQAYARAHDPVEGDTYRMGVGNITVFAAGQNVPPSVWIINPDYDAPSAAGIFSVRYSVDDPDDATRVTLKYFNAVTRVTGVIADSIPLPKGGGVGSFRFDVKTVPNAPYYLYAEVVSDDGRRCDAYWPTYFYVSNPYDGGEPDGGLDSGYSDAGTDGGGGTIEPPKGCGCSGAPDLFFSSLLALIGLRARRSSARAEGA